jgi:hypothetical protein
VVVLHTSTVTSRLAGSLVEVGGGRRVDDGDIDEGEIVREVKLEICSKSGRSRLRPRSGGSRKQGMPNLLAVAERKEATEL